MMKTLTKYCYYFFTFFSVSILFYSVQGFTQEFLLLMCLYFKLSKLTCERIENSERKLSDFDFISRTVHLLKSWINILSGIKIILFFSFHKSLTIHYVSMNACSEVYENIVS